MKLSKLFFASALVAIASGAIASSANAFDVYKDSDGKVYANGVTPSVATEFVFAGVTQTRSYVANTCGAISIRPSSTNPVPATIALSIGGATTNVDTTTLPVQLKPTCTAGAWNVAPTANFKTTTGEVIIIGLTPSAPTPVEFTGATVRNANANTCGIARIGSTTFTPAGSFTVTGQTGTFDVATIPLKANPDICRNGVRYVAQ